jgi:rubrerythrin
MEPGSATFVCKWCGFRDKTLADERRESCPICEDEELNTSEADEELSE